MSSLRYSKGLESVKTCNLIQLKTHTIKEQELVEYYVGQSFASCVTEIASHLEPAVPCLLRHKHLEFLTKNIVKLPPFMTCLDSSKPWIAFWIMHSLKLLDFDDLVNIYCQRMSSVLVACENKITGGYGGGPGQMAHLATTYAAINAYASFCREDIWKQVDRKRLHNFLRLMKQPNGAFTMHVDGELDVRGVYCALAVAHLCNIQDPELTENCVQWIMQCQTYEGGFGSCPGNEAHGGYTYCAVASLTILKQLDKINMNSLLRWMTNRQMAFEGGFSGRTNKLVDGCYSFWQGALFPLVQMILVQKYPTLLSTNRWLFNQQAMQEYLICACQEGEGGLMDKPGRHADFYHTCYCLSGLSIAQDGLADEQYVGGKESVIIAVQPAFNVTIDSYSLAKKVFAVPFIPDL